MIGVNVKNQISAQPPFLRHLPLRPFIIGTRIVDIGGNHPVQKRPEILLTSESLMPQHNPRPKQEKTELSLFQEWGGVNEK